MLRHALDKTLNRQFGPSLIFEMAIPIALHLGVNKIITLGWDIGDISKFDGIESKEFFQEHFDNSSEKIVYAKTPQTKLELQTIIDSTEFFNKLVSACESIAESPNIFELKLFKCRLNWISS